MGLQNLRPKFDSSCPCHIFDKQITLDEYRGFDLARELDSVAKKATNQAPWPTSLDEEKITFPRVVQYEAEDQTY